MYAFQQQQQYATTRCVAKVTPGLGFVPPGPRAEQPFFLDMAASKEPAFVEAQHAAPQTAAMPKQHAAQQTPEDVLQILAGKIC